MGKHREGEVDKREADDLLHNLSDKEWKSCHDAQFGKGSTIPDDQLEYVWNPGTGATDLTPEELAKKLSKGEFVVAARDVRK